MSKLREYAKLAKDYQDLKHVVLSDCSLFASVVIEDLRFGSKYGDTLLVTLFSSACDDGRFGALDFGVAKATKDLVEAASQRAIAEVIAEDIEREKAEKSYWDH